MIKYIFLLCTFSIFIFVQGCSRILEPVILNGSLVNISKKGQEEFNINIKNLNFKNAIEANKDPYPRYLMSTGSGAGANVFDEANFLQSSIPEYLKDNEYRFGINDELSFNLLSKFIDQDTTWPKNPTNLDYIMGTGDELTFIQYLDSGNFPINENSLNNADGSINRFIQTEGIIGNSGNILLLGVGNIQAANRTLDDVRTEIRNVLIRNGQAPNFQLEISQFNSKKAFVKNNFNISTQNMLELNNIPVSLKQVTLNAGVSDLNRNTALIILSRNNKSYRFTASQLFNKQSPEIYIQDKDQIQIEIVAEKSISENIVVGSAGNILLPIIGELYVLDKSLSELQSEVRELLIKNGYLPEFQLELIQSRSNKIYLIEKNGINLVLSLPITHNTLKDIILSNSNKFVTPGDGVGLIVVTLKRNKKVYRSTLDKILDPNTPNIWVQANDQIEVKNLKYKPGQVYALSGAGNASILTIEPSRRETLANVIFSPNGAFTNLRAKRSEIYLLRGKNPAVAYHLDAQNVSRILVAAKTELRPSDIVYVADRPIISFSRLLSEVTPLRILLRDINEGNIP